jgi:AcrR family transcriptional regulator
MMKSALKKSNGAHRNAKAQRLRRRSELSAADWVVAAEDLLAQSGVNSLEISTLCERLAVTKGSFYWHFDGRGDLSLAILEQWRRRTTHVNDRASRVELTLSSESALRYVLAAICKPGPNRDSAVEKSVRDWARADRRARKVVVEVDQIRLSFLQKLFQRCDFNVKEAQLRAYIAYAIMMGDSILRETISPKYELREYIAKYLELLLSTNGDGADTIANDRDVRA